MNDIFLLSPHHTGTWFLFDLFKTNPLLHTAELGFIMVRDKMLSEDKPTVLHMHVNTDKPRRFHDFWHEALMGLCGKNLPTVMPMRDPLASIVSRERRHPEFTPHLFLIDAWISIHHSKREEYDPYFVPIDRPDMDREKLLLGMAKHCGLEPWPGLHEWIKDWPVRNATNVAYDLRNAYLVKDVAYLEKRLPRAFKHLRSSTLQVFFEEHGYKDLMWYE